MVLARTSCAVILSACSVGEVTTIEDEPGSGGVTTCGVARPPSSSWAAADPARAAQTARAARLMSDLPSILFPLVIVNASFCGWRLGRDACPESPDWEHPSRLYQAQEMPHREFGEEAADTNIPPRDHWPAFMSAPAIRRECRGHRIHSGSAVTRDAGHGMAIRPLGAAGEQAL